jgi:three-Cys-motif partner protein
MAKKAFRWKPGKPAPAIESHSDAKLRLLASYLDRYFDTVAVNPAIDRIAITFVDGFSGGGQYLRHGEERPGSPFVLLEAVSRAQQRHNENRQKPLIFDARFIFVDAQKDAITYLNTELRSRGYANDIISGRIALVHSDFEKACGGILAQIRDRHRAGRSIFVLDQKGWNAVQFETIRGILASLPRSEVLLTFAVDWLMSYLNDGDAFAKAMRRVGIEGHRLRRYVEAKGLDGYQFVIPRLLLEDISEATGAPFYSPFFLRSEKAQRDLWIVHLSKIVTARNVMVSSHWDISNSSLHRGAAGLEMLGFDPHWEEGVAFDFGFDAVANEHIAEAMINSLPYKVEEMGRNAIPTVDQFLSQIANDTAATKIQIDKALSFLHAENEIDILNASGNRKRAGSQIQMADRVRLAQQPMFQRLSPKK